MKSPDGGARANLIKPQGGDTVFLRGDEKRIAMYLERTYIKDRVEYGTCSWTVYEMFDDELIGKEQEKDFLLSELTLFIDKPRKG
jgi:hypothetical protein